MDDGNSGGIEQQLVVFQVEEESYGLDVAVVHEIIRMQHITRVPNAPFFVAGVIDIRGKVVPVVDMRKRFGLGVSEEDEASNRIMVVDKGGQKIGIVVDAVTEVLRVHIDSIELPSDTITTGGSDYVTGIAKHDGKMIILLDIDMVLSRETAAVVADVSSTESTHTEESAAKTAQTGETESREEAPGPSKKRASAKARK